MSGSARSLQSSSFSGLRVASLYYTPAYSKNGKNISAKLEINAFMNMAARGGVEIEDQIVKLTTWGKMADICARSMSNGKEFNCNAKMRIFDKRVFMPSLVQGQPGTPVLKPDGSPLMTKGISFTIDELTFGEESNKHIDREIAANVRPLGWNVAGSVEQAQWKETLKSRQAIQFDPNSPTGTFGYATIRMPVGAGIGAYIPNQTTVAAPITATVAVVPVAATPDQAVAVPVNAGGFVVPAGV